MYGLTHEWLDFGRLSRALALLVPAVICGAATAQNSVVFVANISTLAGNGMAGFSGDSGLATAAMLSAPGMVAYDPSGNLYIADTTNDVIRKVTPGGIISTVAGTGGVAGFAGDGGPATAAQLSGPAGIAFDAAGNLYIADTNNARIREVSASTGVITTIAGNGTKAVYTANGPALTSPLDGPNSIALDSAGNVYIADSTSNRCLELVVATQQLVLFAGASNTGGGPSGDGGLATAAKFSGPRAVAADHSGNIYLVDRAHSEIRKINIASGMISTVAGNATAGFMGDGGPATAAELSAPVGAFVDNSGNLFIADSGNQRVREVSAATGNIATIAGNGTAGYTGDGSAATSAELNVPSAVAVSAAGQIAIADTTNNVVRAINGLAGSFPTTNVGSMSASQNISAEAVSAVSLQSYGINPGGPKDFTLGTVTGCTVPGAQTSGTTCTGAVAFNPTAPGLRVSQVIAKDSSGNQYTFPLFGIGSAPAVGLGPGMTTTYAGSGTAGSSGDGGLATAALLNAPLGVAFDSAGDLYIADTGNNKIRAVSAGGTISTVAGTGTAGYSGNGAAATAATLNTPSGVAVDPSGNVYIADTANDVVRLVGALNGTIGTFAGTGATPGYSGDGGAATNATLNRPKAVATDQNGNLYIADTGNNAIREVTAGTIGTLVGSGATAGVLSAPAGVTVDAFGNVYIADTGNNEVRKYTNGTLTVVAGSGVAGFAGDGGPATSARLSAPTRIAVDAAGDLYIADSGNNRIRFVSAATNVISTIAGTGTAGSGGNGGGATSAQFSTPSAVVVDQLDRLFVADTTNNRVQQVNSTAVTFSYGSVNVGSASAVQVVAVTNIGNQSLSLSAIAVPTGFAQSPSGGTDCTSTSTLAPGAACLIGVVFQPSAKQTYSGSLVITDNALNGVASTQSVALSGTGTIPSTPTTLTIASGNNQTASPLAPFATPLKVMVTDQNGVAIANVAVTFTAPASGAAATFAGATNVVTINTDSTGNATAPTLTADSTRGAFNVTASVSGIPTPATFTETIAGSPSPQLTLSISPATNPQTYGQVVQLTVNLTPATFNNVAPTGTVTFLDGGSSIRTATVSNATASITFTPAATTAIAHMFTASYGGDSNFSSSTNSNTVNLTVNPLAITATASSVAVVYNPASAPSPVVTLTGTLNGVLAADQGKVTATYSSTGLKFAAGAVAGTSGVGTYPIVASLVGSVTANNYTLTSTSGQVTVTKAGTSAMLATSSTAPGVGSSVTLTATLTSATTGTPTGTVSFYNGSSLLGTATVTNGIATYATTALPVGPASLSAAYAGDANFNGSTTSPLAIVVSVPGFTLNSTSSTVQVAQGDGAYIPVTLGTVGSFTGTINLACTGLPANSSCVFVPAAYTTSATVTSASGIVQLVTSGPGSVVGGNASSRPGYSLAGLLALPGLLLLMGSKRHRIPHPAALLFMAAALLGGVSLMGCGSTSSTTASSPLTPAGTSTVTISATSGSVTSNVTITLNVTQAR